MHKAFKACTAVLLALVMTVSLVNGALAAVVRNDDDTISYEPLEQGVYSKGGYTIDKVSHPTLGAGEVDGILTGDLQDRGQSYSWSMAEAGDYVYIGTCYNSTYHIYHNNVKTSLDAMKKEGKLDQNVDTSRAAADFVMPFSAPVLSAYGFCHESLLFAFQIPDVGSASLLHSAALQGFLPEYTLRLLDYTVLPRSFFSAFVISCSSRILHSR